MLDPTGSGDDSFGILGIQWYANRASVDVISLSLGSDVPSDGSAGLSQAVDAAVLTKGKIVVAATGNGGDLPGTITSPGSAAQAITVGATADWSAPTSAPYHAEGPFLAWFSSRGPTLDGRTKPDIVAPGVNIGGAGGSFAIDLFHGPVGTAPPPPPSPTVHVGDLDDTSALLATGWRAQVRILVEDQDRAVVAGAIVTGKWPNGTTGTCTTNASGLCKIGRKLANSKLSIVFTVTKVTSAVGAYKPADNHDPDGDSNGTKITLVKP